MKTTMAEVTIRVVYDDREGGLTEKGWNRLADAITDAHLEDLLSEQAHEAVRSLLPRDFPDVWYVATDAPPQA